VIASLGHDLDHEGKNNNFLINTHHKLAVLYNDKSPLENHHCAVLFKLLSDTNKNIFENMDPSDFKGVRAMMIENILSTDMKVHFSMLADFKKELLENPNFGSGGKPFHFNNSNFPIESEERKLAITNLFIHTADLSGSTKEIRIATKWTTRVNEEFAAQVCLSNI
jgi:cAMP-specific phosphodiesterase 4